MFLCLKPIAESVAAIENFAAEFGPRGALPFRAPKREPTHGHAEGARQVGFCQIIAKQKEGWAFVFARFGVVAE